MNGIRQMSGERAGLYSHACLRWSCERAFLRAISPACSKTHVHLSSSRQMAVIVFEIVRKEDAIVVVVVDDDQDDDVVGGGVDVIGMY